MATKSLRVFDPHWKQDLRIQFASRSIFSSLTRGLLAVETTGIDWARHAAAVARLLESDGTGFLLVAPWAPVKARLCQRLRTEFPTGDQFETVDRRTFVPSAAAFARILELRSEFGGPSSGIWCFGVVTDQVVV